MLLLFFIWTHKNQFMFRIINPICGESVKLAASPHWWPALFLSTNERFDKNVSGLQTCNSTRNYTVCLTHRGLNEMSDIGKRHLGVSTCMKLHLNLYNLGSAIRSYFTGIPLAINCNLVLEPPPPIKTANWSYFRFVDDNKLKYTYSHNRHCGNGLVDNIHRNILHK